MNFGNQTDPAPYIIAAYLVCSTILIGYAIFLIRSRRQLRLLKETVEPNKN